MVNNDPSFQIGHILSGMYMYLQSINLDDVYKISRNMDWSRKIIKYFPIENNGHTARGLMASIDETLSKVKIVKSLLTAKSSGEVICGHDYEDDIQRFRREIDHLTSDRRIFSTLVYHGVASMLTLQPAHRVNIIIL